MTYFDVFQAGSQGSWELRNIQGYIGKSVNGSPAVKMAENL